MRALFSIVFLTILLNSGFSNVVTYQIPKLFFEMLHPGFRLSIPADTGVTRVAFNVNRNKPFTTFEEGDFSQQERSPTNNRFVFETQKQLEDDDIIYVWISVQYMNLIYRKICDAISVQEYKTAKKNPGSVLTVTEKPKLIIPQPTPQIPVKNENNNNDCEYSITKATFKQRRNTPICRGDMILNENFEGNLDGNLWKTEMRFPSPICEDEFVMYNASNINVKDGLLQIRAHPWNGDVRRGVLDLGEMCTETSRHFCIRQPEGAYVLPPVVSGRVNTKNNFSFQYGRIVVRAKLPQGNWLYPLMYLEPVAILINDPLPCFHTRLAFVRGNINFINFNNFENLGVNRLSAGPVLVSSANIRERFAVNKSSEQSFADDFHIYEMIWNEESLIFTVDGDEYGRVNLADLRYKENNRMGMPRDVKVDMQREFALTFGVAAGGHSDFPDGDVGKPWSNTSPKAAINFWRKRTDWINTWTDPVLKIDYVRDVGIKSVLYAVEKNEQCPSLFDYINEPINGTWTSTRNENLRSGDKLAISILVQNEGQVYKRNENYEIAANGVAIPAPLQDTTKLVQFDTCEIKESRKGDCQPSITMSSNNLELCSGQLVFEENFKTAQYLNTNEWAYEVKSNLNGDGDEEFTFYSQSSATTFIENGNLNIKPFVAESQIRDGTRKLENCTSVEKDCFIKAEVRKFLPPISSACISTKNSFNFKYGRVVIKAKLPMGDWIFPQMLLRPENDAEPRIRIAHALGNAELTDKNKKYMGGRILSCGTITWNFVENRVKQLVKKATSVLKSYSHADLLGNGFHEYSVEWSEKELKFFIDDFEYATLPVRLDKKHYISLGVSVGGHYEFPDDSLTGGKLRKPWKNFYHSAVLQFFRDKSWQSTWNGNEALQVEYIHVYAL